MRLLKIYMIVINTTSLRDYYFFNKLIARIEFEKVSAHAYRDPTFRLVCTIITSEFTLNSLSY